MIMAVFVILIVFSYANKYKLLMCIHTQNTGVLYILKYVRDLGVTLAT